MHRFKLVRCQFTYARRRSILVATLLVVLATLFYLREYIYMQYYVARYIERDAIFQKHKRNFAGDQFLYKSSCACRRQLVSLSKSSGTYFVSIYERNGTILSPSHTTTTTKSTKTTTATSVTDDMHRSSSKQTPTVAGYNISAGAFESAILTCDMYNSLRRGPGTRVLSYSLYGNGRRFYEGLRELSRLAQLRYPGWIIRVHHDSSIDRSIICEMECLRDDRTGEPYDNVDFCSVERLPYDTSKTWSAAYMHGMTWRWLPLGDTFVDFFGSRDLDAWIPEREIDSVRVCIKSNTVFHVMRDAMVHHIPIIGGYWGFANVRNRPLGEHFFRLLTNPFVASFYNEKRQNKVQRDQDFLTAFLANDMFLNVTAHDSFWCHKFGGQPWPSQRPNYNCFVGCSTCCDQYKEHERVPYVDICPKECRPKEHQDWIHC